jgi:hypothetical protein
MTPHRLRGSICEINGKMMIDVSGNDTEFITAGSTVELVVWMTDTADTLARIARTQQIPEEVAARAVAAFGALAK